MVRKRPPIRRQIPTPAMLKQERDKAHLALALYRRRRDPTDVKKLIEAAEHFENAAKLARKMGKLRLSQELFSRAHNLRDSLEH